MNKYKVTFPDDTLLEKEAESPFHVLHELVDVDDIDYLTVVCTDDGLWEVEVEEDCNIAEFDIEWVEVLPNTTPSSYNPE